MMMGQEEDQEADLEIEIISMEQEEDVGMHRDPLDDENNCEFLENQGDEYNFRAIRFESLFRKITTAVEDEDELLLELDISGPSCSAFPDERNSANNNDEDVIAHTDNILPQELDNVLERLLQTNSQNLETIRIRGVYHLGKLSFPPLVALTKLTLTDNFGGLEGLWGAITSIDYGTQMPGLEEFEIIIRTVWHLRTSSKLGQNFSLVWPEFDVKSDAVRKSCCGSLRKLTLELEVRSIRLFLIRDLFPNISSLEFRMNDTNILGADPMPVAEISRLWPHLQELRFTGQNNNLLRNYDADFIGINEAEAELLRKKDEEYLERLQIVPVKPSLITMTSLKVLGIQLGFAKPLKSNGCENSIIFVSELAEILALRRMSLSETSVCDVHVSGDSEDSDVDSIVQVEDDDDDVADGVEDVADDDDSEEDDYMVLGD